jgi:hypothetical protein
LVSPLLGEWSYVSGLAEGAVWPVVVVMLLEGAENCRSVQREPVGVAQDVVLRSERRYAAQRPHEMITEFTVRVRAKG